MKKKVLDLSVLVGSAMLTGCIDPSNDNSSVLQNALIAIPQVGIAVIVGLQLEQVLA